VTPVGWEAIRAELLRRIRARDWPPGALIPGEEALAVEFGCARATVNRALRDLAEAGLLDRRRRAGTRVAQGGARRAVLDIPVIRAEVAARGQTHAFRLLDRQTAPAPLAIAARMGLAPDAPLLFLETLHLADGRPFAHETRWLNPAALPGALPDFRQVTANEWLIATLPYATGEIDLSAEPATAREADVLGIAPGTPLFVAERATRTETASVTWVRLCHAPGYRMRLTL
jgi:GntR family histidine utilization transcriptional repressor